MQGNPKVIDLLLVQLASEYQAIQSYDAQAAYAANQGYPKLAALFRDTYDDERRHAGLLLDRIAFLEGKLELPATKPFPIDPRPDCKDWTSLLSLNLKTEMQATNDYQDAALKSWDLKDLVTHKLFRQIAEEEQHHIDEHEAALGKIKELGPEMWLLSMV